MGTSSGSSRRWSEPAPFRWISRRSAAATDFGPSSRATPSIGPPDGPRARDRRSGSGSLGRDWKLFDPQCATRLDFFERARTRKSTSRPKMAARTDGPDRVEQRMRPIANSHAKDGQSLRRDQRHAGHFRGRGRAKPAYAAAFVTSPCGLYVNGFYPHGSRCFPSLFTSDHFVPRTGVSDALTLFCEVLSVTCHSFLDLRTV